MLATEAGSAAYLVPLVKTLRRHRTVPWRLFATDIAAARLQDAGVTCDALLPPGATEQQVRHQIGDWRFERLLISATGAPLEAAAYAVARAVGAKISAFVDAFTPCIPRFAHDNALLLPDEILVIDHEMAREAAVEGLPSERLKVVGQPAWEGVGFLPDVAEDHVLFISQPVRQHYGNTLGYDEQSAWRVVIECRERYPDTVGAAGYAIHPGAARLHVSPEPGRFAIEHDAHVALDRYGAVVGMFSSFLVDALLAGRRVVSVQPGLPPHDMCALSRRGLVERVGDAAGLAHALRTAPRAKSRRVLETSLAGSVARLSAIVGVHA